MHSAVKWIILVAEMLVPLLHFLTPLVLFVLAGIDISTSLVTIPLVTHPEISARTAILQTNRLLDKLSRYVRPLQRAYVVIFFIMGLFSLRHSDATVHWRMPYHVVSLVIMCQIVWYDLALMMPLERRIRRLGWGQSAGGGGGGSEGVVAGAGAAAAAVPLSAGADSNADAALAVISENHHPPPPPPNRERDRQLNAVEGRWEAVRLLQKWERRQRARVLIPFLAALVSLAGLAARGPAW